MNNLRIPSPMQTKKQRTISLAFRLCLDFSADSRRFALRISFFWASVSGPTGSAIRGKTLLGKIGTGAKVSRCT